METIRLPFKIGSLYGGCAKLEGFVILEAEHLTLEYRMSDNLLGGLWAGNITRKSVAYRDLDRADYGLGFFLPRLHLTARSLSAFHDLPTADGATLKLSIPWGYRHQLRSLTSTINLQLSFHEADRYRDKLGSI